MTKREGFSKYLSQPQLILKEDFQSLYFGCKSYINVKYHQDKAYPGYTVYRVCTSVHQVHFDFLMRINSPLDGV